MEIPIPKDDFKWFGEGFDGFPKRLPDDTIEYAIYVIDSSLTAQKVATRLRQVLQHLKSVTKELLVDYIWQRDSLNIEIVLKDGSWSLQGQTNFGDSIADEWLIVYILRELSKTFPDIWVRVYDTDGEFLLIEAANVLPKWLKPEISENRVWIHAGELRIIPLPKEKSKAKAPSLQEAIKIISSDQTQLLRSPLIEEEAFFRIGKHPKAISEQFHQGLLIIPRKIAYILHEKPAFISPVIDAFYLRDAISLRVLADKNVQKLRFPPSDLVKMSVRFPKVGYAQLKGQEFNPPESWTGPLEEYNGVDFDKAYLGMKLTCGFEMLISDQQNQNKKSVREMQILLDDLESGEVSLPTDEEMKKWSKVDESESWMDIDYNDFDRELSGTSKDGELGEGFGDKAAQENLRKMVARFEAFLNDDKAGLDGADFGDSGSDDDEDYEDLESDEEEGVDQVASFDEEEFSRMMREMMGLPPEEEAAGPSSKSRVAEINEDVVDEEQVKQDMAAIEAELKEAGVLDLNPSRPTNTAKAVTDKGSSSKSHDSGLDGANTEEIQLAKNMLEAFKSQGGAAGPAGNLMGLMNVRFPPDKDD